MNEKLVANIEHFYALSYPPEAVVLFPSYCRESQPELVNPRTSRIRHADIPTKSESRLQN